MLDSMLDSVNWDQGPTLSTLDYSIILQWTSLSLPVYVYIYIFVISNDDPSLVYIAIAYVFIHLTCLLFLFFWFLTDSTHWNWDFQHSFSCVDAMTSLMERTTTSYTFGSKQSPSSSLELDTLVPLFNSS